MCVLQFSSQRKLFNFVYLHIKGFVLSFHQRFYEPHSNSESVQKHLNFMNRTLIPGKRFWPVAWIFCENCRQFSIRDSCTHSYCMANFVIGNFLGSKYFQTFAFPSHLGPVSTIFDWLILQPAKNYSHLKISYLGKNHSKFDRWTRGSLYSLWRGDGAKNYTSIMFSYQACTNTDNSRHAEIWKKTPHWSRMYNAKQIKHDIQELSHFVWTC